MASSLRIPDELKKRIASLATEHETTPHSFMLSAIREKVEAEEAKAAFYAEGRRRRLARMKRNGVGIPAAEVFEYLTRRAEGKPAERPRAREIR